MILHLLHVLAAVPLVTLGTVILATWLLRRRPGRLPPLALLLPASLLLAADDPLPLPGDSTADRNSTLPAHHTVGMGVGVGTYQTCAGPRSYGDAGVMYRYSTPISRETAAAVEVDAWGGQDGTLPHGAGRAAVGLDHRYGAGSVGFVAGALSAEGAYSSTPILPSATLRIGPRDMFYVEAAALAELPAPLPRSFASLGIAIAFPRRGNQWEPLSIAAGLSASGIYLSPTFAVGENLNADVDIAYADAQTWASTVRIRLHLPKVQK